MGPVGVDGTVGGGMLSAANEMALRLTGLAEAGAGARWARLARRAIAGVVKSDDDTNEDDDEAAALEAKAGV